MTKPLTMSAGAEAALRIASKVDMRLHALLAEVDALRAARKTDTERIRREECNRCVAVISWAADNARESNRKKAAAELDMLARDIADAREAV